MPHSILEKLWQRTQNNGLKQESDTWNKEIETLYNLGISMETTLQYLYFDKPDFHTFLLWIDGKKKDTTAITITIDDVLSEEDLAFWEANGYVVLKQAISQEDCKATQQAIWDFLGMNPANAASWYNVHEQQKGMMLNFTDHESLNRNRLSLRIRKAYEQLYQSEAIYKTIDKVSFNPPVTESYRFMGSPLHWDISLKIPAPLALQGLLYLTDCGPEDGAFHCVPGFHNKIESWLEEIEPNENPRQKALETLQPVPITANAGDFIIWNTTLPHCASPNHGAAPRMVQYIAYLPNDYKSPEQWI